MRFRSQRGNKRAVTLLWVLCTICTLFSRICYDNMQTDSSLAYADIAVGSDAASEDLVSALCSAPKGVPAQQAYVSESSCQGSTAFIPRKTAQRINPRGTCGDTFGILPEGIFSDTFSAGLRALSSDGLCEIVSNTVILQYIHKQDGEKA